MVTKNTFGHFNYFQSYFKFKFVYNNKNNNNKNLFLVGIIYEIFIGQSK